MLRQLRGHGWSLLAATLAGCYASTTMGETSADHLDPGIGTVCSEQAVLAADLKHCVCRANMQCQGSRCTEGRLAGLPGHSKHRVDLVSGYSLALCPDCRCAACSPEGADPHWPDLGGCCAGLAIFAAARPANYTGYCAASAPQHGVTCWSTMDVCR